MLQCDFGMCLCFSRTRRSAFSVSHCWFRCRGSAYSCDLSVFPRQNNQPLIASTDTGYRTHVAELIRVTLSQVMHVHTCNEIYVHRIRLSSSCIKRYIHVHMYILNIFYNAQGACLVIMYGILIDCFWIAVCPLIRPLVRTLRS